MKKFVEKIARSILKRVVVNEDREFISPVEFTKTDTDIFNFVLNNNLTVVGSLRLIATIMSCKYVIENNIYGDFVECGVWRGGNSIAAKLIFEAYDCDKKVHLFDTFSGLTEPSNVDMTNDGTTGREFIARNSNDDNKVFYIPLENVNNNFANASVDMSGVNFVKGDVCETLLDGRNVPKQIAILRLDTDWYESTKIEMEILYPLLSKKGVLLIDDYGHWVGARKAVDEFFANSEYSRPFFQYTDNTGRAGIK